MFPLIFAYLQAAFLFCLLPWLLHASRTFVLSPFSSYLPFSFPIFLTRHSFSVFLHHYSPSPPFVALGMEMRTWAYIPGFQISSFKICPIHISPPTQLLQPLCFTLFYWCFCFSHISPYWPRLLLTKRVRLGTLLLGLSVHFHKKPSMNKTCGAWVYTPLSPVPGGPLFSSTPQGISHHPGLSFAEVPLTRSSPPFAPLLWNSGGISTLPLD